jgi:hypothetical protein
VFTVLEHGFFARECDAPGLREIVVVVRQCFMEKKIGRVK